MSPAVQQLTNVLLSLCQLEQGLQVLCWAFSRWVPAPHPHAATTKVALPQLQQCQQQLQQELLPAVVALLEKAGLKRSSSSSTGASSTTGGGNAAQATKHQQTADPAANVDSGRQQLEELWASAPVSWTFSDSASGNKATTKWLWKWVSPDAALQQLMEQVTSGSHATAQQQQQQQLWEELQQLLGSGQLQSWLAAASSALPLRWCCNNPGCSNLGTAGSKARGSELRRVGGRQCSSASAPATAAR
jgi:hypothetical protein